MESDNESQSDAIDSNDESIEVESDDDSSDSDDGWADIVQDVYDMYEEMRQRQIEKYRKDMSYSEACEQASLDLHHVYKKELMNRYKKMMLFQHDISLNDDQQLIEEAIDEFREKGYTYEKALKRAMRTNSRVFDDILNDYDCDSDSSSENTHVE